MTAVMRPTPPSVQSMKLRAELARRGLLSVQLQSYWSPDTDSTIDPKRDPETVESAVSVFCESKGPT